MADTVRTKSELLVIFQDNTTGEITEQDMRDFVVTTFDHSENTSNPHSVTATQTGALVSIDGVSNAGGDVDLVAGTNITITPDDVANTITITAAGGGNLVAVSDPGNGNNIVPDSTAGVHSLVEIAPVTGTRGLPDPTQPGSILTISCTSNLDFGDVTITASNEIEQTGISEFILSDLGDYITLLSVRTSGVTTYRWRRIASSGIDEFETYETTGTDPGNGNQITATETWPTITTVIPIGSAGGGSETRTVAAPTKAGSKLQFYNATAVDDVAITFPHSSGFNAVGNTIITISAGSAAAIFEAVGGTDPRWIYLGGSGAIALS